MWLNRFWVPLLGVVMTASALAQPAQEGRQCPPQYGSRKLVMVQAFSGPPANRVELIPRLGGWDLIVGPEPVPPDRRRDTLLCTYDGDGATLTITLPYDTRVCEYPGNTWPNVVCR